MLKFKSKNHVILGELSSLKFAKKSFIVQYICEIDHQGQFYYNTNNNNTSMVEDAKAKELSHL